MLIDEFVRALASVMKIINPQLEEAITYNSFRYFVRQDEALLAAWQTRC